MMEEFHLSQTLKLKGASKELLTVNNQWAAIALDKYHINSKTQIEFILDTAKSQALLSWDSDFEKSAMREAKDIANHGGVALAMFVMSVLYDYEFVEQSEIGEGVDYRFSKEAPAENELNFLGNYHYVEISGLLEESGSNTQTARIRDKHDQINRGSRSHNESSVIVTLFSEPRVIKEVHK